ncbi:MAG: helix-turn-helix domain-containing protein [Myxococcota bacterium]
MAKAPTKRPPKAPPAPPRERMLRAAIELLASGGRAAASTRAVSAAAGVQAPAIYRQFGDLDGLLQAAAHEVLRDYVQAKSQRKPGADPVDDLRRGWDQHVAFGLTHPAVFALLYTSGRERAARDARDVGVDDPMHEGESFLAALVQRVAAAGRLRVSVAHAGALIRAAGCGATLTLIATPESERDLRLSADLREATLAAITVAPVAAPSRARSGRVAARAIALRAVLDEAPATLSAGEQRLLGEWLDRLARTDG